MCVIIVCPKGVETPSKSELYAAHRYNPHGCGFVSDNHFYKGLDFEKFVSKIQERTIDENLLIHFRYATHGSISESNCHPFKKNSVFFMHNGVLPIASIYDKTDSQICFEKFIYPAIKKYGLHSEKVRQECDYWCNDYSKFAIMKDNEIELFGHYAKIDGRLYSNTRHFTFLQEKRLYSQF